MYDHEDREGWIYHGEHDTLGSVMCLHKRRILRGMVS